MGENNYYSLVYLIIEARESYTIPLFFTLILLPNENFVISDLKFQKKDISLKLIIEGLLTLIVASTPILFYFYKYLPDSPTLEVFGMLVESNGFQSVRDFVWFIQMKLLPLILCCIWFFTCKQWYYPAILVPIAMYSFQLYTLLSSNTKVIDEGEVFLVLAVTLVIIPIVYFIRVNLVDKYVHGIDLKAIKEETNILKEKEELRKERERLEKLLHKIEQKNLNLVEHAYNS